MRPDIIRGVSVGAINAVKLAEGEIPATRDRASPAWSRSGPRCNATATCTPWCGRSAGWREPAGSEATALLWRIAWQSTVFAAVDLARNPLAQVPAWIGAKGREQACRGCGRLVRVCPNCDRPHRWLDARLLTCDCGRAFL